MAEVYGRLTVLAPAGRRKGKRLVLCQCACGSTTTVVYGNLKSGNTTSCGCAKTAKLVQRNTKHGAAQRDAQLPSYRCWVGMIARCYNESIDAYASYGARGIRVCDRWRSSFAAFLADMGARPSPDHSLDRVDNDGDYEPGNVRWATPTKQANNRRTNKVIEHAGEALTLVEWSRRTGIPASTIRNRLRRGWSTARALTQGRKK